MQPARAGGACERVQDQNCTDELRQARRDRRAGRPHAEHGYEQKIQHRIGRRADDQEVQRPPRIPHRAQDARAHIIDHGRDHAGKIPLQIDDRILQRPLGWVEQDERRPRHGDAEDGHDGADENGEQDGRVDGPADQRLFPCPVMLGDDDSRAGGQPDKKADDQIDDRQIRAADGGQRRLAHEPPENDGVDHGIQLLQERAEHDRDKEAHHIRKHRAMQQIGGPGS